MLYKQSPYFKNQREIILQYLEKATHSIVIAMAYFTDKVLFDKLLQKTREKVQVYLLVQDDEINRLSGIEFNQLNGEYGEFVMIGTEQKLNSKFCVIDCCIILHGSYNWTYQATDNIENLTVSEGDIKSAAQFIVQFFRIGGDFFKDAKLFVGKPEIIKEDNIRNRTNRQSRQNRIEELRKKIQEDLNRRNNNSPDDNLKK
jgi:phosphatidylserine/phosphatidylglycerophosphate/cardiolipin synthase-like enzyme